MFLGARRRMVASRIQASCRIDTCSTACVLADPYSRVLLRHRIIGRSSAGCPIDRNRSKLL
jgi:hypothetical protein